MSRASVASASAQAEAWRAFAFFRGLRLPRAYLSWIDLEPVVRWSVPVALTGFVAILAAISFASTFAEQDRTIAAATSDVEMAASLIANEVEARLRIAADPTPAEALTSAIPRHLFKPGQHVLLSDANGTIVGSYPESDLRGSMNDHLGTGQPLTILAEKAGVMRLTLPGGAEALATVHSLHGSLGQVAVFHPMHEVLGEWRASVQRTVVLLATTAAVLAALTCAYLFQATRARRADRSCRLMRNRVDMVLSRGRCGLWDWNMTTGAIDWSMSMFEILDMAPKAQSFDEISALVHPADAGLEAMALSLSSNANSTADHLFRMRGSKGKWVWLRTKAELVQDGDAGPHLIGIAIDVTETMALEERTAKADMRLRDAIETISEAFVVWDAENRLVMCNSKFQRFHNLPNQAVAVGTSYAEVMERGTTPLIQSQVVLGEALPLGARTFEAQLSDGRWLQINERRTKDGGYVSVGTDITALKRNETQLIESESELRLSIERLNASHQTLEMQKQQLVELSEQHLEQKAEAEQANRAKSDFLANMGHELRTPLNAILGFSEMMMLESFGPLGTPLYAEYSRDIHTSGQYLLGVFTDVLEMSRLDAGRVRLEKEEFLVEDAIQTAMGTMSAVASANGIAIESEPAQVTPLLADRTAVEKILTIVLNNAVKYSPACGNVTVRTRAVQGAINIYVEDTGVGIPPEAIARLGRPFEQSDKTLKNGMRGSGLGLAIARSLVDLHGGSLRIGSQQGVGTVVQICLPNRRQQASPARLQIAASGIPTGARPSRAALQAIGKIERKISHTA